jgi:hypothetical protein
MKYKVSELEGGLLDAAVAKAEGLLTSQRFSIEGGGDHGPIRFRVNGEPYAPSEEWKVGGPIIERERIVAWRPDVIKYHVWAAILPESKGLGTYSGYRIDLHYHDGMPGPTLLVAAMRAYVASKFGDEVELA